MPPGRQLNPPVTPLIPRVAAMSAPSLRLMLVGLLLPLPLPLMCPGPAVAPPPAPLSLSLSMLKPSCGWRRRYASAVSMRYSRLCSPSLRGGMGGGQGGR